MTTGKLITYKADALVFAVGVTGMQKIVQANPSLGTRPEFQRMMNLRGIDVVSTRLWLDKKLETQFPANVLAGFDENMGSTYFNLNDLQVRSHHCCTSCEFSPAIPGFSGLSAWDESQQTSSGARNVQPRCSPAHGRCIGENWTSGGGALS